MGCSHNCSECQNKCEKSDFNIEPHKLSNIKHVIAVVSGKGGVGKSMVTSLLATFLTSLGKKCAILDADITGPSIPKMFGVKAGVTAASEHEILPNETVTGIKIMSANLLLNNESDPVIWRGPILAGMVKQFWSEVIWGDIDYMLVDCPPGTGDVPLTVFQSLRLDGIIVVTSPQDLVSMIVAKILKMAEQMQIKVLGCIENMSYVQCLDCGKQISVFGKSKLAEVAAMNNLRILGKLPLMAELASVCDEGKIETLNNDYLQEAVQAILHL